MDDIHVLVVDDEPDSCNLVGEYVKNMGYKVTTTLLGTEALALAKDRTFDVIMTDLQMPDVNGIEILEKSKGIDPDIVVVIITGYPSFETVQAALRLGAYDYVTKPFKMKDISSTLERAVAHRTLLLTKNRLEKEMKRENIRLEEMIKEKGRELRLIYQIASEVSSSLDLDGVLNRIVSRVSKVLNVEICSLLLFDKTTQELTIKAAQGLSEDVMKTVRIRPGEKISGWVFEHKEAILVNDIEIDDRFAKRNQEKYYTHSFISAPLIVQDEVIGVINVNNRTTRQPFSQDEFQLIKGITQEVGIAIKNANLFKSIEESYLQTIKTLTLVIDAKDSYTYQHSENVTRYALEIAQELNLSPAELKEIKQACQLHDLGKVGVHDYILTKKEKLTPAEWEEIKSHPLKAVEILESLGFLSGSIKIIEQHHEHYDGKGYPHGLKDNQIEQGARIIALADSYDAMTTKRPYRETPMTKQEAMEEIKRHSGTQFDPELAKVFLTVLEKLNGG